MSRAQQDPVIVGVGQILQRLENPQEAAEPLEMMLGALRQAGEDALASSLLPHASAIYVPHGAWGYSDPGREIAHQLKASPDETVDTPYGGNYVQTCISDAAEKIQAGTRDVVLIAASENGRTQGQAQRQGIELSQTDAPGSPDRMIAEVKAIFHDAEIARGMNSASDIFAIIESAIRFSNGETLSAHTTRIAELWKGFNTVAQGNPNAWLREPYSAKEIGAAASDNPMISYPYTRRMNANARVDMGAGLLLCSVETARDAGVPEEKIVYIHAGTEAHDSHFLSTRENFHRSPGMRIAGGRALQLADTSIDQIDHFDLYSCFPSAVQVAANELGIPQDRALTVTGGLTFGGGPLNSYGLHAVARMTEVLREHPGQLGLVSSNGGWLAKHAFGIYSTRPPANGFQYENLQGEVDALPLREARVDWEGPVTIEAYTVAHQKGEMSRALVACLTDAGERTWATLTDPSIMSSMMREEFCGRRAHIDGQGQLSFA